MPDDPRLNNSTPGEDPKTVWLNQPTERTMMTMRSIQQKSRDLHARTSRKLLGTLAGPAVASLCYVYSAKAFPAQRMLLQPFFLIALAWSLAGVFFLNRGMWPHVLPSGMALSTGVEFCRRELERQRDLIRGVLLWTFGPAVLAIGTFILALARIDTVGNALFPRALPFLIAIVIWVVAYLRLRVKEQRDLQREIDELDLLQRENRV